MKYPVNKIEAKHMEDMQARWGVNKELGRSLIHYFNDLGAKHELPSDKDKLVDYVNRFHRKMTLDNNHCPGDIYFDVIYTSFCSAVLNGSIELPEYQPHAVKNQVKAFRKWITSGNTLDRLYEKFYKYYPSQKPKQIENKSTKLEDWPDEWIKDQYEKICIIFEQDGNVPIFETSGAKSYFNRIKDEYVKRFDVDPAELLYG